ncbi:MAG: DUF86 domain-containing protein [Hyphomicrobiales bacterium]|nr:DUF86 domain-containing protein [Hyphomicrobiales bacterium]
MISPRAPLALYHILDAIRDFEGFVGVATAEEIGADRMRRYAAERCVEIISEASRRLPETWKAEHPSIPWSDIAGIGSVLGHDYEDVNLDVIVKLRGTSLGDLRAAVVALLQKYDPESDRYIER